MRQRKEEIKRAQQEQKRKKRALLQEKEEQLKNKLRVCVCVQRTRLCICTYVLSCNAPLLQQLLIFDLKATNVQYVCMYVVIHSLLYYTLMLQVA